MKFYKKEGRVVAVILMLLLGIYWAAILRINFAQNPTWYCTDMYSDMLYSVEVWNQKSIFPSGWVFGNQLYVVATPVLAALFYGLTQDPCVAMGIASTLMGFGVIVSFYWMIKPFFMRLDERLMAVASFMTLMLLAGDPVIAQNGWQLFFTMCSYYACYAIATFLVFGCYFRNNEKCDIGYWLIFTVACVLSFATGIQSLRQTAVMVIPLICVEVVKILYNAITKKKNCYRSMIIVGVISFFNLVGVVCSKFIVVQKNEIFGSTSLQISPNFLEEIVSSCITPFYLVPSFWKITMLIFAVACISALITIVSKKDWMENSIFLCMLLCISNVAVIWGIDVFTTMSIRVIYYFLLFPMEAIGVAWLYSKSKGGSRTPIIFAVLCMALSCGPKLLPYFQAQPLNESYEQVSDYLQEQGITTVYSFWNLGEKAAIASDFHIQAGFWGATRNPFKPIKYLCNPAIFDVDAGECAYFARGTDAVNRLMKLAQTQGASLELMKYFQELNVYVFTADVNLMQ